MTLVVLTYLIMIFSAISMILTNNPVYALKFLILTFLNFGFLLVYVDILYLGLIFIMVYVGAVLILFVFVIMMLDIKYSLIKKSNYATVGFLFAFLFSLSIFIAISYNIEELEFTQLSETLFIDSISLEEDLSVLIKLGTVIFNYYFVNTLVIGILLLVATIGAIYLTHVTDVVPTRTQSFQKDTGKVFFYTIYDNLKK
uniref:NADH-ubiquinone oxidoreductase chain 6 n=1 Tax=Pharyngomonas kirbyi TaxID=63601 RepID=A0A1W6R277_9EUKA|nr:NADH dehydrogenase subunit 6 [Pharyngomonas kirbyi]ARO48001.1 NADH dehydrogenase subunit 6 [Pharyngomonas kirbyi]